MLREFGFDRWDPEMEISLRDVYEQLGGKLPSFVRLIFMELELTFVTDELCKVWCAEGYKDLSAHGFHEHVLPADDEPHTLN